MVSAIDMVDASILQMLPKLVHVASGVSGSCKNLSSLQVHPSFHQILHKGSCQLISCGPTFMQDHSKGHAIELEVVINEVDGDASEVLVGLGGPVVKGEGNMLAS